MATDTVILANDSWDKVQVQVTKGNNTNAESNPSLGSRTILRDDNWTILSDGENIWYRRDSNPDNPDGSRTYWTLITCNGLGDTINVTLN
jgi:hypothetical protein